jgi:hypothetical protein
MIKKIYSYLLIISLLITALPLISFGQTTQTPGNFLEISMSPENPQPLQTVQISLQSFSYDLDRSAITWSVNGQIKKTEVGTKVFTVRAGENGVGTTISASVETPADGTKTISISFVPSVVDLIYESLSYTPPFYKGKALNPSQGIVRVTAIPNLINSSGVKINTQNIVYTWKKDNTVQGSVSGLGKNTFTFTGTIPVRDALIEVETSSLNKDISASNQVKITSLSPKILFYENNPIYGVLYNQAILGTVKMTDDEFSATAIPYFFGTNSATSTDLKYSWSMNDKVVNSQDPKNNFTTRVDTPGSGVARINLKIDNKTNLFQLATSDYKISFIKQ